MPTREGQSSCYSLKVYTDVRISEIVRAVKILKEMRRAHEDEIGAIGLDGLMIDAPMIKQAQKIINLAKTAGLEIPS